MVEPARPGQTLQFHQPILITIEQRNPELASRFMTDHLTDAREICYFSRRPPANYVIISPAANG